MDCFADGTVRVGTTGNNYLELTPSGASLVSSGTVKSFVVDHPLDDPDNPQRWLVHGCDESPTAIVSYSGQVELVEHRAVVELPSYFEALTEADGRTVQLTPEIVDLDDGPTVFPAANRPIVDGRFEIACGGPDGTRVSWLLRATRRGAAFDVEPKRADVVAHSDGPYRCLTHRPKTVEDAA